MNKIFLSLVIINTAIFTSSAESSEYCWTEHHIAAYFMAASQHITCQNGDSYIVKNPKFDSPRGVLQKLTNEFMQKKGYALIHDGNSDYSNTVSDVYVKGLKPYTRYCKLLEFSAASFEIRCSQKDSLLTGSSEFVLSVLTKNKATALQFLQTKGFEKIEDVKKIKTSSLKWHNALPENITLFGSGRRDDLCDSQAEGLTPPFTMSCI